jgi:hypothetical protein
VHARNLPGNISIKLTQLGLVVGRGFCENLTRNIASRARELHRTIEIDMEASAYTEVTLEIFEAVQRAAEMSPWQSRPTCTVLKMISSAWSFSGPKSGL